MGSTTRGVATHLAENLRQLGLGGATLHSAYAQLHYNFETKEMLLASDQHIFHHHTIDRDRAREAVAALLATEDTTKAARAPEPSPLPPVTEGGSERGPPQRDKVQDKAQKFNLGACLQQEEELRVLSMLEENSDRFAFSMEDIEPASFKGEAMRIDLLTHFIVADL